MSTFHYGPGRAVLTGQATPRLSAIREGICPTHGTALERQEECGWCEVCGCGYSITPDKTSLHFEFEARECVR